MDIPFQNKAKRGPKKMPYCLNKPKPSNPREDKPIVEATTSKKTKKVKLVFFLFYKYMFSFL